LREATTARALRSEHVVRIWETGELASGQPYLVMERLSGVDLDALLDARGPLPLGFVVDLALQAAAALAEAHAAGIVHRDLKPANLFLACKSDGTPILKVVDFGISKAAIWADQSLTNVQSTLGTPSYMAPEQIRSSKDVDHRADIWSLGVTIFELLTGRLPFEGRSIPALTTAIVFGSPRNIRELRPELPEAIVSIIAGCLSKDLDQRYADVSDLIRDLEAFAQSIRVPDWDDEETTKLYSIVPPAPSTPAPEPEPEPESELDPALEPPSLGAIVLTASLALIVAMVSTVLLAFHQSWLT
jgi:serine/threonine-protein kinase